MVAGSRLGIVIVPQLPSSLSVFVFVCVVNASRVVRELVETQYGVASCVLHGDYFCSEKWIRDILSYSALPPYTLNEEK